MQLAPADAAALGRLRQDMKVARESYPDLARRLAGIEDELLLRRWLRCDFVSRKAGTQGPTPLDALAEFRGAAGVETGAWHLSNDGLTLQDFLAINLGPYGNGTCTFQCVLVLPTAEGFRIEAREAGEVYHRARWTIADGVLRLTLAEDERPAQVLREERITGNRIGLGLELGPQGTRSWIWGSEVRHAARGLREGSPASIQLELPKGTIIQAIAVWPEAKK
jgi:hypothetical protein